MQTPEIKIKRFLDGCGSYLLYGDEKDAGVLTDYKRMRTGNKEIPLSSYTDVVKEALDSGDYAVSVNGELRLLDESKVKQEQEKTKRKKKEPTKHQRMRKMFADGKLERAIVDTENCFNWGGNSWMISKSLKQYSPIKTTIGSLYDMDTVYCFTPNGAKHTEFYDYSLNEITKECDAIGQTER